MIEPRRRAFQMFGHPAEGAPLQWDWVLRQLSDAGTYWVVARSAGYPHPRPVWGAWHENELYLSIGSPVIRRAVAADPDVTVHLESGTDVVIIEGRLTSAPKAPAVSAYNTKYDWDYEEHQYGPLARLTPALVTAWRAAGPAGRDSFTEIGSSGVRLMKDPDGTSVLSLWSRDSLLSIGSQGSILSIGSVGSIASVGSIGSAGSLLSIGSVFATGSVLSATSRWSLMSDRSIGSVLGTREHGNGGSWRVPATVAAMFAVAAAIAAGERR